MESYLKAVCECDQQVNPLFIFLGAQVESVKNGEAIITLPISPKLSQGIGLVAGGILATLVDEAMAHAAMSILPCGKTAVTIEINVRYLRSTKATKKGFIRAIGKVLKPGRGVIYTTAEIHDSEGRLLATAGGSFYVLDIEPSNCKA